MIAKCALALRLLCSQFTHTLCAGDAGADLAQKRLVPESSVELRTLGLHTHVCILRASPMVVVLNTRFCKHIFKLSSMTSQGMDLHAECERPYLPGISDTLLVLVC